MKNTTYQRILKKLIEAQKYNTQYYRHGQVTPPGWVPADVLMKPSIGGISALRRVRELRAKGFRIEWKYFVLKDGTTTKTTLYKLITPYEKIDIKNLKIYSPMAIT